MIDPKQTSAPDLIREAGNAGPKKGGLGKDTLAVQPVKDGAPPPSQPIPRSDTPATAPQNGISDLQPLNDAGAASAPPSTTAADGSQPSPQDAQPAATGASSDAAATPPAQVNEAAQPAASGASSSSSSGATATEQAQNQDDVSTSKAKKKKGLHKLVPF